MTKQSLILGALALVISGVAIAPQVLAYRGDPNVKGPNYTAERHEQMEKAFETGDYNAWKALANKQGRVTEVVNASNFSKFAKAHELAESGKTDEANKIRAELGLGLQNGSGMGSGMHKGMGRNSK